MRDFAYSWHQLLPVSSGSDREFAQALDELPGERLDDVSAQLVGAPRLLCEGLENYPVAVAAWGRLCPEALSDGLLRLSADLLSPSLTQDQKTAAAALGTWLRRSRHEQLHPADLQVARAFADHLEREVRRRVGVSSESPEGLTLLFDLVARCNGYGDGLEDSGHRRRLRDYVDQHPDKWVTALSWLLQVAGGRNIVTLGTLWAKHAGADPLPVLQPAAERCVEPMATRALGLLDLLDGDHDTDVLLARIAVRLDRGRPAFPRPLAEPTSTWLSDLGLEHELRSAIGRAASEFAEEFQTQGPAEEEGHVASLLTRIELELRTSAAAREVDGAWGVPAEVTGSFRRLAKSEEAVVHADLALTVEIDVVGQLDTTFTELVQVKKAQRLGTEPGTDSWRIKIEQLTELLAISATSVYWLLRVDGSVLVVPAKLLLAIARGQRVDGQGTFTLHYASVRHAAVTLPSHLVDLTLGGWLGSSDEQAVERGAGAPGNTRARALFRLRIRSVQG